MKFEWDIHKEKINLKKHKIDFKTASTVFLDTNRIEIYDENHSILGEIRFKTIGRIANKISIVTVVYTERSKVIRIISARKADKKEVKLYDSEKEY